jgi:DNA-binding response OmpR family regulator
MPKKPPSPDSEGSEMTEAQLSSSLHDARALIDALIRASHSNSAVPLTLHSRFTFGEVVIDLHYRRVTRNGDPVSLTPREYDLLVALARGGGAPVSTSDLMRTVWKGHVAPESRTIAQHVAELRSKLERVPARPEFLHTVRKFGYRLIGEWRTD